MSTPNWKLKLRVAGADCANVHRDDALGVQRETFYRRRFDAMGRVKVSKATTVYFVDGDPRQYSDEKTMLAARKKVAS